MAGHDFSFILKFLVAMWWLYYFSGGYVVAILFFWWLYGDWDSLADIEKHMNTIRIRKQKLTVNIVSNLESEAKEYRYWDTEVTGLHVRVSPLGNKRYYFKARLPDGKQTEVKLGNTNKLTLRAARDAAREIYVSILKGNNPNKNKQKERTSMTVKELCDKYQREGIGTKKPSTIATDKGRIEGYIIYLLGNKRVKDLTKNDIQNFMNDVKDGRSSPKSNGTGGKGTATRTVRLLGGILTFAVELGVIDKNPTLGVKKIRR